MMSSWLRWSMTVTGSVALDFDDTPRSTGRSSTTSRPAARAAVQGDLLEHGGEAD